MRSSRLCLAATLALGLVSASVASAADKLTIKLKTGDVVIELADDVAPLHAARLKALADAGEYDNVAFHRVIEGFMAQTGDVEFGDMENGFVPNRAGLKMVQMAWWPVIIFIAGAKILSLSLRWVWMLTAFRLPGAG